MSINYDRRFRYVAQKNFPNKAGVAEYGYNNVNKPTQNSYKICSWYRYPNPLLTKKLSDN